MAAIGIFKPPPPPPTIDDSIKVEHAIITEVGAASLLKVKVDECDPNTKIPIFLKKNDPKVKDSIQMMEAGPCEYHLLVPAGLGLDDFEIGDHATFQRTRNPVTTIFQTENIYKLVYRNEGDLKQFMIEGPAPKGKQDKKK
eukprot:MONOS_1624.1-p1 / transcript=MONOS_1624.1 / gene=MONOS_1624 / organism=Monocercomonoides_exilis_PA203 / gene_product=unspecified product / transcript_product=unspecified product / location=Mono_scaffold00029:162457-163004(+) / protein_length=141 / sequence_SO=supercontig / SO=protein_coding / is_pseudo=false